MWKSFGKKKTIAAAPKHAKTKDPNDYLHNKAHHAGAGRYVNPWPSAVTKGWMPTFQIPFAWAEKPHPGLRRVKVVKPDFDKVSKRNELKATWLGHAGVLVQLPILKEATTPITVVIDPIFSERASPTAYAGPGRYLPSPCQVEDLPHADFVLISHNHYDHLDYTTMTKLIAKGGEATKYVIPLGLKQWFIDCKVPNEQIVEMDWWEEMTFQPSELNDRPEDMDELGSIRISCVPAQHSSARTGWDKCTSLWAGFVVEQFACKPSEAPSRTTVYFAGDTGYRAEVGGPVCPAFEQIGKRYGPMDFSTIPIWRGGTLNFVSYMGVRLHPEALTLATHATPEDAVSIHSDVLSRSSLAIHYASFAGSEDEATYPIALLEEACADVGIEVSTDADNGFGICDVGETVVVSVRPNMSFKEVSSSSGNSIDINSNGLDKSSDQKPEGQPDPDSEGATSATAPQDVLQA